MRLRIFFVLVLVFVLPLLAVSARATSIPFLGTAGSFSVLGASTVTNTGATTLGGDLGVWPGTEITGSGTITLTGAIHLTDPVAHLAQSDASSAFTTLGGLASSGGLGPNLNSLVVGPGVWDVGSALLPVSGVLTLAFTGSNQNIIFRASDLTTVSGSSVLVTGADTTDNVFWVVGSSATIGTTTSFVGHLIALTSVTMATGATDGCGSVIALNAAVTLDHNTITTGCSFGGNGTVTPTPVTGGTTIIAPEPGTFALLSSGLVLGFLKRRKLR